MNMPIHRRSFIKSSIATGLSLTGLARSLANPQDRVISPYGDLIPDPKGILDLPKGFSYQIISKRGSVMSDGFKLPGMPDGMAAFSGTGEKIIIIRNHELGHKETKLSPYAQGKPLPKEILEKAYDTGSSAKNITLGGTTTTVYNPVTKKVEKEFLSLAGTDRNCAGGAMPWGSWITCEEPADLTSTRGKKHGYCFEVKANDDGKLQKAIPLKALGRFRHEAVALDPDSGILYLTEDIGDGLLYRFIPNKKNDLTSGKLQALAIAGTPSADTRNWKNSPTPFAEKSTAKVEWIDLEDIDNPNGDLRKRGHRAGAAVFARGEGIIYADGAIYACLTSGGPREQGQIYKITPAKSPDEQDSIQLFLEPKSSDLLTSCDNICSAPWGDLMICEDLTPPFKENDTFLRGVTPKGEIYTLARNAADQGEFAGSCFSPDGSILFVNIQRSGYTIAITGDWEKAS